VPEILVPVLGDTVKMGKASAFDVLIGVLLLHIAKTQANPNTVFGRMRRCFVRDEGWDVPGGNQCCDGLGKGINCL